MTGSTIRTDDRPRPEREQLDLFRALPGDLAPRNAQDLMAYPFYSLAKSRRIAPILSPLRHFAYDIRQIVRRQTLPGYRLVITADPDGAERLNFAPDAIHPLNPRSRRPASSAGDKL